MVSELVTTAIRYGKNPIKLRMILQSALTCEVSDATSTAPHLRRARDFDEGGRGLLHVAHPTEHWGTRHNREGKCHLGGAGDSSWRCGTPIRSGVRFLRELHRATSCAKQGPTCHSPPDHIALRS